MGSSYVAEPAVSIIGTVGPENPRTCIYTKSGINIHALTNFCPRDLCAIKVQGAQDTGLAQVVMSLVYMSEPDNPPLHDLSRLVYCCEELGLELNNGNDSNAHHAL